MTIPSLPTDATYKLILIIGILLIITSAYNLKTNSSFLIYSEFKTDSLNRALKGLKGLSEDTLDQIENSATLDENHKLDSLNNVSYGFTLKEDRIVNDSKYFAYKVKQSSMDVWYSFILIVIGFIMTLLGYRKWSRQQAVEDEIKRKQLQMLELEYKQKLNSRTDYANIKNANSMNDLPIELYNTIIGFAYNSHGSINYTELRMSVNDANLDEALQTLVEMGILIHWENNDNYGTTALGKRIYRNGGYGVYVNEIEKQNKSNEQRIIELEESTIESNKESVKQTAIQKNTYYVAVAALGISILALLFAIFA